MLHNFTAKELRILCVISITLSPALVISAIIMHSHERLSPESIHCLLWPMLLQRVLSSSCWVVRHTLGHDPDLILSSFELLCLLSIDVFVVLVHRGPLRVK